MKGFDDSIDGSWTKVKSRLPSNKHEEIPSIPKLITRASQRIIKKKKTYKHLIKNRKLRHFLLVAPTVLFDLNREGLDDAYN